MQPLSEAGDGGLPSGTPPALIYLEFNRNHYFAIGLIVLLLGIQFRFVESYLLSKETSQFIQKRIDRRRKQSAVTSRVTPDDDTWRRDPGPPARAMCPVA